MERIVGGCPRMQVVVLQSLLHSHGGRFKFVRDGLALRCGQRCE